MPMTGRLYSKICIVTGAASGIGRAIAQRFAEEGATVVATDCNLDAVAAVVAGLPGSLHDARALDVTQEADWERVFHEAVVRFGRVDVLVNNAGVPSQSSLEDTTIEEWRRVTGVNLDGTFLGCKHAVRRMKLTGGGAIVNVSSVGALKGSLLGPAYGASKAAVWNLTKTVALASARAGYGIRCNSVHPGLTHTPMMEGVPQATLDRLKAGIPVGRLGEPREVANAVLHLASDEAAFTTGTQLVVDGGYTA